MNIILDSEKSLSPLTEAKKYLSPYIDHEEGGLLLGTRKWNEDRSLLIVTVRKFIPIKTAHESWNISKDEMCDLVLPSEVVGYYPNPSEVFKIKERIKPFNEKSDLVEVGFVHNHMNFPANPSIYDRTHVCREFGYIMAIYSNKFNHLKCWYISQITETQKQWQMSKELSSLAQVELAHIL